ncbi:hypothetical protein ACMD2_20453 [Ananas comosus]|uniref:Uncharacterized protein n=1 Tax=Ananas comosus TaxID=4615 RepID=A0A199V2S5_ANACO|nr:hypothetical protein ACMD2_20453 [Ananas comosus]
MPQNAEMCGWERQMHDEERRWGGFGAETNDTRLGRIPYKPRRRKSETLRAQYINTNELRHDFIVLLASLIMGT